MKILWTIIILSIMSLKAFASQDVLTVTALSSNNENVNVKYDLELVGNSNLEISSLNINDLIQKINGVYVRKKGYGDRIFVVPGSRVDIFAFTKNLSTNPIDIYSYRLFLSRTNLISGDLTRLGMYSDGIYQGRKFAINTVSQNLETNQTIDAYPLYSFNVLQPIQIQNYTVTYEYSSEGVNLEFNLIIENSADYQVCNVELYQVLPSGKVFEKNACIDKNSSLSISYADSLIHPVSNSLTVESLQVKDNNYQYESISTQKLNENDSSLESTSMILDTSLGQVHALGSSENNITIVRIPYWLETEIKVISFETDIEITFNTDVVNFLDGKESSFEFSIHNKGSHIYHLPISFTLNSSDLFLPNPTIEVMDLYFGQTRTYSLQLKSLSKKEGRFNGAVMLTLAQTEYLHEFEYTLSSVTKSIQKQKTKDENNVKSSNNILGVVMKKTISSKKEKQEVSLGIVKGVSDKLNNLNTRTQSHNVYPLVMKVGIAIFLFSLLIIFILIWLW